MKIFSISMIKFGEMKLGEEDFRKEHERRFSSYIISRCGNEVLNEAKKNNRDG